MTFVHKTFARVQGPPSIARRVQTAIWWRLYSCVLLCYWVNTNFSLSQMLYKAKDHHTRCCLILFSKRLLIFFNSLNFFYFSVYNWNRQYVTRLDLLVTMAKWKRRVFIFKKVTYAGPSGEYTVAIINVRVCVAQVLGRLFLKWNAALTVSRESNRTRAIAHTTTTLVSMAATQMGALGSFICICIRVLCKDGSVRGCSEPMNDTH